MSLTITINNINNINDLTDLERAVLRLISGDTIAGVLDTALSNDLSEALYKSNEKQDCITGTGTRVVEPSEVCAPAPAPAPAPSGGGVVFATGDKEPFPLEPDARRYAVVPASADLDSAGLPWDKRIHASSRAKVAAGTWRYKRGVEPEVTAQVEAELRAVQALPVPPVVHEAVVHGVPTTLTVTPASTDGWPFPAVVPLLPVPTAPPAAALPMTFAQLMQHITPMLVSGQLTQPMLESVTEKVGLPHLSALGARPDLVETVRAAIDEAVGGVS